MKSKKNVYYFHHHRRRRFFFILLYFEVGDLELMCKESSNTFVLAYIVFGIKGN
jgi:hypothetical protein